MFHLIVFIVFTWSCSVNANPKVKTQQGLVEGYYDETFSGKTILAFEGVPYATPPVGDLRFQEPKPPKPWNGTWHAKQLHVCQQYFQFTKPGEDPVIGDEDCLYLNIYTPEIKEKLLEVIVHLHGGAFMFGAGGLFGHQFIMERDVVYVSLNYRLGPLGFLSTEDNVVPGNNGLKDQLQALKWLKENVEYFGGNPDSITLTGMSAGSASVHLHYLSPLSEGLFHRGIALSGSALNPWVLVEKSREKAKKLATLLGCPEEDSFELVKCLKTRPSRQIVGSVKNFLHWLYNPFSPFGIVVDKWSYNPIIPRHPYLLLKEGKVKDLPIIFTQNENEGLYPASDFLEDLHELEANWNKLLPHILDYDNSLMDSQLKDKISEDIRRYYLKGSPVTRDNFLEFVKILSDRLFLEGIEEGVRLQAKAMSSPVYYYHFTYRGAHSLSEFRKSYKADFGASHGDDLIYVLPLKEFDMLSTEEDRNVANLLVDMWVSFAENSKPKIKGVEWEKTSRKYEDPLNILFINSAVNISMKSVKSLANSEFWKSLPFEENRKLFFSEKDEL